MNAVGPIPWREPRRWRAQWCWAGPESGEFRVLRFSAILRVRGVPRSFVVYLSADTRYRFRVNGRLVGRGPLKGTLQRYFFEAYDIAGLLVRGRNRLEVEVRYYGAYSPGSVVHAGRPGFLFQAESTRSLDTPGVWRAAEDRSVEPDTTPFSNALGFLGHLERVDARRRPGRPRRAFRTGGVDPGRAWGVAPLRALAPREIPGLAEEPRRFVRVLADKRPPSVPPAGWSVPAGHGFEIVLDAGALTTGYPVLAFEGGRGRIVTCTYGEAFSRPPGHPWANPVKGVRDDPSAGGVHGYADAVTLPGGRFVYEPFHWRTFWYLKLRVSRGRAPLVIHDAAYRFTTYPQPLRASFASSDPDAARMWEVSWRTLQLCAHETYEDCPYHEQYNYLADSRLQALCAMALANEREMPRRTIRLFRDSVRPDGLVHSRVPSRDPQVIPYFALVWVLMVADFWEWFGESERGFVRSCLNVVDGVLWFFRERLRPDGFVGRVPGWNMVDENPGWLGGAPPSLLAGASTYLTGMYACALAAAMRLHREAGRPEDAARWTGPVRAIREAIRRRAWDGKRGLFLEGPGRTRDPRSQHAQIAAILSGAATSRQAGRVLERLTGDPALLTTKFMQSFYLARALELAGGYGAFHESVLEPWRAMLAKHLSTWAEYPDPGRSDCHAWSSWIAYDFVTRVLGVRPGKPGFAEILIRPQPGALDHARGGLVTPVGEVHVAWRRTGRGSGVELEARVPDGVPVRVELPGRPPVRRSRGGAIRVGGRGRRGMLGVPVGTGGKETR